MTIEADHSVNREWRSMTAYEVHDVTVDVTGCSNREHIRSRLASTIQGLAGCARVTLIGELDPDVDVNLAELAAERGMLDAIVIQANDVRVAYDFDRLSLEQTVQGQFIRDVREVNLDPKLNRRVLVTGLRALQGRKDLEVI